MSTGIATVNDIGPGAALTLATGTLVLGSALENAYHPLGFKTAAITPFVNAVELNVDLRTSALRPLILSVSSFIAGTLTIQTRTGADVPVQTFAVPPSPVQLLSWAARGESVRPSIAFQKINFLWTLASGAGNPTPFELFHLWCAPAVTELFNPDLPVTREFRAFEEIVAERGRPLSTVLAYLYQVGARPTAELARINTLWEACGWGVRPGVWLESWHQATPGATNANVGFVFDWSIDRTLAVAALHPGGNSFDMEFEVATPPAPR